MAEMQRAEAQAAQVGGPGRPCPAQLAQLALGACSFNSCGLCMSPQVYRRVMSRYPQNGRLLLLYGRFLEDVQHDPWAAAKHYRWAG